jgi:NADPH:quinone reductase-like Zn-dependent oxidoreductase
VIEAETGGRGADVILDNMGAAYLGRNVAALAFDGRIAMIGLQGGRDAEINLGAMMRKRAALFTTSLRDRPPAAKARIVAGVRDDLWPHVAAGRIRPVIDRGFPLAEAAAAHRYMESGSHVGKNPADRAGVRLRFRQVFCLPTAFHRRPQAIEAR